ncbi:MAG TPA: hypothetical protein VEY67_07725 [Candidatus Dormibacteraeota bacterium]|nr:hypothetical protein [Candidatus Dormibacteraeota bacterium]
MATRGWWAGKARQFRDHIGARVSPAERDDISTWLSRDQLALFDAMTVADRRHGLDVVDELRRKGVTERDVLVAGLLHDAGKGRTGLWPRVVFSLGQAYGPWVWALAGVLPQARRSIETLRDHAERSARLAEQVGCEPRTVELIRHQEAPLDEDGRLLHDADEAS